MNDSKEEFSTPKLNGEGDGIKNITVRRRVPVPSSRKFNARIQQDENLKLKLGNALTDMEGKSKTHGSLKKSQTVAEITPTRSKVKKRPITRTSDESTTATLHATPRPLDGTPAPSPRRCLRERAVCTVYQRLLLCVWRRCRARLATLSDSCGRQQDQISQLEIQVDVLKNLRNSESNKRSEALNENQQLRKKLEILEMENRQLCEKLRDAEEKLENTNANLKLARLDLKKSSEQIASVQDHLRKKKDERIDLLTKISTQEYDIISQNSIISQLEEALKTTEKNLQNAESNYKVKEEEYSEALQQLRNEVDLNYSLNEQLCSLQQSKQELEDQTKDLADQLDAFINSCEQLQEENLTIRTNLGEVSYELQEEKKKSWFKNTRQIALLSLAALQKVAYVMLPAYLDNPMK